LFIASFLERGEKKRVQMFQVSGARVGVAEKRSTSRSAVGRNAYSQRVFLRGDVGHTHTIGAGEEIKKPRRLLFVLKNPHHLCSIPKTAALILGARDRQMVFFFLSFFKCCGLFFLVKMDRKIFYMSSNHGFPKNQRPPSLLTNQTKKKSWRQYVSSSGPNRMEQKKSGQGGGGGGRVADG
jgi:hypothetical protein